MDKANRPFVNFLAITLAAAGGVQAGLAQNGGPQQGNAPQGERFTSTTFANGALVLTSSHGDKTVKQFTTPRGDVTQLSFRDGGICTVSLNSASVASRQGAAMMDPGELPPLASDVKTFRAAKGANDQAGTQKAFDNIVADIAKMGSDTKSCTTAPAAPQVASSPAPPQAAASHTLPVTPVGDPEKPMGIKVELDNGTTLSYFSTPVGQGRTVEQTHLVVSNLHLYVFINGEVGEQKRTSETEAAPTISRPDLVATFKKINETMSEALTHHKDTIPDSVGAEIESIVNTHAPTEIVRPASQAKLPPPAR